MAHPDPLPSVTQMKTLNQGVRSFGLDALSDEGYREHSHIKMQLQNQRPLGWREGLRQSAGEETSSAAMNSLRFSHSVVRFAIVGIINTLAGLGVIYALKWQFDTNDVLANEIGYVAGLNISFILNGRWTFSFAGSLISRILPFVAVVFVAPAQHLRSDGCHPLVRN